MLPYLSIIDLCLDASACGDYIRAVFSAASMMNRSIAPVECKKALVVFENRR